MKYVPKSLLSIFGFASNPFEITVVVAVVVDVAAVVAGFPLFNEQ